MQAPGCRHGGEDDDRSDHARAGEPPPRAGGQSLDHGGGRRADDLRDPGAGAGAGAASVRWRAENGAIVGESTPEKKIERNTFVIWRGGEPKDFELKVEFKMNSTNSGIQYRSVELKDVGQWVLKGYQADIDFDNVFTGQIYEERGRGFLALRGQAAYVSEGQPSRAVGTLESGDALKALIKQNDWNQVHIIARGNSIVQIVNGHVMSVLVDDDVKNRALSGLLGFQMHVGNPMRVEYRNIWLKQL